MADYGPALTKYKRFLCHGRLCARGNPCRSTGSWMQPPTSLRCAAHRQVRAERVTENVDPFPDIRPFRREPHPVLHDLPRERLPIVLTQHAPAVQMAMIGRRYAWNRAPGRAGCRDPAAGSAFRRSNLWRYFGNPGRAATTINESGRVTGGEAGIRTLGRGLKPLQRFSKPPPSASRPPHRDEIAKYTTARKLRELRLEPDCPYNCPCRELDHRLPRRPARLVFGSRQRNGFLADQASLDLP